MPKYKGDLTRALYITGDDLDKFLLNHKIGEVVKYPEYISTTSKKEFVMHGNIFINIKNTENGRDISKINQEEREVLYERGSEFIIKNIQRISYNKYKIDMEELKLTSKEKAISELAQELQEVTDKVDRENIPWEDKANETIIVKAEAPPLLYGNPDIKHLSKKETGNLEDPLRKEANRFSDSILIYGAGPDENGNKNRDKLVLEVKTNEKNPLIADSFLDNFNSHHIPEDRENEYMTDDLKKLVNLLKNDRLISQEVLNDISKYKESIDEMFLTNKVSPELNKEILEEFIKNPEIKNIFNKIEKLNNELEFNKDNQDEVIEKIEEEYKNFFSKKTIYIADKILTTGGKIYFTLDGVATDFIDSKLTFNQEKLEKILFDRNSEFYNKVTSEELRFLYNNHLKNPNLKFIINRQVVDTSALFSFDETKITNTENKYKWW